MPAPTNNKSTFDELRKLRRPYYILSPEYERTSAGVRAMHLLCHYLNQAGQEAYIVASVIHPGLRTPRLTPETRENHFLTSRIPIAVYPEIVFGNPLNTPNIVRYILNHPGLITGPKKFPDADLLYFFNFEYTKHLAEWPIKLLKIPLIDRNIFHPPEEKSNLFRCGSLVYQGRATDAEVAYPKIAKCITKNWPSSHQDLAELLRSSEKLYIYANSSLIQEALACGCPVIMLETPYNKDFFDLYRSHPETPRPGIALDQTEIEFTRAKSSIQDFYAVYQQHESTFVHQLHTFINETQALCFDPSRLSHFTDDIANTPKDRFATTYHQWLSERSNCTKTGGHALHPHSTEKPETLHLIVRLPEKNASLISNTLDSLAHLIHSNWYLDIITPLPAPDGINEVISNIGWHQISEDAAKEAIDKIIKHRKFDWVLELPPGAALDPLYFFGMQNNSLTRENTSAFFVDDDICLNAGSRVRPRLKLGVNPEMLRSSDLAGPLCVRRDAWTETEGASHNNGSPWFAQLLRIADKFGWNSIKHIPDVLISYSGTFPTDTDACLLSLYKNLQSRGIQGDFVPATNQSWNIRYPLITTPQITIAVISQNQLELLTRCFYSIVEKTSYPNYEIFILVADESNDPDMLAWLENTQQQNTPKTRIIKGNQADNYAAHCNNAVKSSSNEFVVLIKEDTVVIQAQWLEELVRTCLQEDVAAASPRLIAPGTSKIQNAGSVLGLGGLYGSPYQDLANLGDPGYLDCLQVARDVSILPAACMLVRTANYLAVSGMDDSSLGNYFAEADLCLKLRKQNQRLIYQPLSTLVDGGSRPLDIAGDFAPHLHEELAKAKATETFTNRWLTNATVDPFWNPNLSLVDLEPTPETSFHPQWQYLPTDAPRILTRPLSGAQATYRITSPLHALRKAGMASECIWPMGGERDITPAELVRLAPDSVIVQHYLYDHHLAALQAWQSLANRPFTVYSLDDLISQMAGSNPFIKNFPSNSRTRLKYALDRCDRLVVTTNTLAEMSQGFISDIQVVPNRLEQDIWLPLHSKKRTSSKPRIGWAGGSSHQADLILLKEVIEQTRDEADWIFFGMCPEKIRPLLTEFHGLQALSEYPKKLASLNLDIAVAPLAQIPFNQAKSNLRLLEYGALAIPVVCTDIDPYRGSPACCVSNTVEAWVAALRERIHAPDAREQEGIALRSWVRTNFLLENGLEEWLAAHIKAN